MKKIVAALASLVAASALFSGSPADAQILVGPIALIGTPVSVTCANPGSSQDVAKTVILKNDFSKPIPAGKTLSWKASDGDSGSVKLTSDLAPGATLKVQGKMPGNAYTCSAFFFSQADLAPSQAQLASASSVALTVQNRDGFVGTGASVTRLTVHSCGGSLLQTVDLPMTLAGGESKSMTVPIKPVSGKVFVRVMADNGKQVAESNEQNNLLDTMNACLK